MRTNNGIIGPKQVLGDEVASGMFSLNGVGRELATGWPSLKIGYSLGNITYMNKSLGDLGDSAPQGIDLSPDGTQLLVTGSASDGFQQLSLRTPFDISTGYHVTSWTSSAETTPFACRWGDNGYKAYLCGAVRDRISYVPLTTAYDISTAGTEVESDFLNTMNSPFSEANPTGLFFKPDGTKVFTCNSNYDKINEYSLTGDPWDISSGNLSFENEFSVNSQETDPQEICFKPDGTKFYVLGRYQSKVFQYSCSTPWDLSTASYDTVSADIDSTLTGVNLAGMMLSVTGRKLYIVGIGNDTIYQYSIEADK